MSRRVVGQKRRPHSHVKGLDRQSRAFSRRRSRPSCAVAGLSDQERAQGRPGTGWHPWSACNKKHAAEPQAQLKIPGLPCAMVLTAYSALSPVTIAWLQPSSAKEFRGLSACFGAPGPHGLTVRARVSRLLPRSRPPHPASTFVTTRTPLFDEAGRRKDTQFPVIRRRNFRAWPTENPNRIKSPQQISICAHAIWQRKSPVSEAIVGKIAQILPDEAGQEFAHLSNA